MAASTGQEYSFCGLKGENFSLMLFPSDTLAQVRNMISGVMHVQPSSLLLVANGKSLPESGSSGDSQKFESFSIAPEKKIFVLNTSPPPNEAQPERSPGKRERNEIDAVVATSNDKKPRVSESEGDSLGLLETSLTSIECLPIEIVELVRELPFVVPNDISQLTIHSVKILYFEPDSDDIDESSWERETTSGRVWRFEFLEGSGCDHSSIRDDGYTIGYARQWNAKWFLAPIIVSDRQCQEACDTYFKHMKRCLTNLDTPDSVHISHVIWPFEFTGAGFDSQDTLRNPIFNFPPWGDTAVWTQSNDLYTQN